MIKIKVKKYIYEEQLEVEDIEGKIHLFDIKINDKSANIIKGLLKKRSAEEFFTEGANKEVEKALFGDEVAKIKNVTGEFEFQNIAVEILTDFLLSWGQDLTKRVPTKNTASHLNTRN